MPKGSAAGKGGWDRGSKDYPCKTPVTWCCCLSSSIPTMLSVRSEQLNKTGFPTVHAVVLLEGTMNLTGEIQPLVEQLMMVKRMQVQKWCLILIGLTGGICYWVLEGPVCVPAAHPLPTLHVGDLEGMFCGPHRVPRGHRGAEVDSLYLPEGRP